MGAGDEQPTCQIHHRATHEVSLDHLTTDQQGDARARQYERTGVRMETEPADEREQSDRG
jgi:hypothetical protein